MLINSKTLEDLEKNFFILEEETFSICFLCENPLHKNDVIFLFRGMQKAIHLECFLKEVNKKLKIDEDRIKKEKDKLELLKSKVVLNLVPKIMNKELFEILPYLKPGVPLFYNLPSQVPKKL